MPRLAFLLLLLTYPASVAGQARAPQTAAQSLKAAADLEKAGDHARARQALEQAIDRAVQEPDVTTEAEARYWLGFSFNKTAQYSASDVQMNRAQVLYERLGNRRRLAEVCTVLGQNAWLSGRPEDSRAAYHKAMDLFAALEDWSAVANMHLNLAYVVPPEEQPLHIQQGLELARKVGDRTTEAGLLHVWADRAYASDDFDVAFDRLSQARSIYEELGDQRDLARVLTSMGRLYRVHGHPDQAFLFFRRARDLQKTIGDVQGVIQSLNAMSVALRRLGKPADALRCDQEALPLARGTGSPLLLKFVMEGVAATQMDLGLPDQAASTLEEARKIPVPRIETLLLLSEARFRLGRYGAALQSAEEALTFPNPGGEVSRASLTAHAQALWKLGREQEALADIRKAAESVEQARARLVPTDFMKQGFADTDRDVTGLSVNILLDSARDEEALEAAERARGRAFLDLLATRSLSPDRAPRIGALSPDPRDGGQPGSPLASLRSALPASADDTVALARRLKSTVLAYWVDDRSTIIWTVSPDGRIAHARIPVGATKLDEWIDAALYPAGASNATSPHSLSTRGGAMLTAAASNRAVWRHLYDALIRPVRRRLPAASGSLLTVIPSGPLFRLSFAALLDERGRYLIEDYALHYSPAVEAFRYTQTVQQKTAKLPARYLLVANPSGMPPSAGKELPALPGSESEVRTISRLLAPGSATVLEGPRADKAGVQSAMTSATVIHLATHGIVDTGQPLASFLALGRSPGRPRDTGRLTAEEVYSLNLHADLVVLSACRTGVGRISGDGVAGFARAFFFAGAASVVSTLWDVPDQPTAQLIGDFYRSLLKPTDSGKAAALRNAQLHLLRSLRRRQVMVDSPLGQLALPEDPMLWAGYVLFGEP